MAQRLASVLIERVDRAAARASAPTWSTPGNPCRNRRNAESELATSVGIADVVSVIDSPYRRGARMASGELRGRSGPCWDYELHDSGGVT